VFRDAYALHHKIPLHQAAGQTVACHGLSGSSWLFIHDLTNTATGVTLVVLIALYLGTQLASSLTMQAPTMDQTQRRLMLVLPPLFVILIVKFPAGLILYWITANTWTIGQQWVIRKRIGPVVPAPPAAIIPVVVAGLLLLINASGALYWLAGAVLWAVVAGSGNAWVLIVEIVRDARYRPLDQEEQS
jgi:hypothetical protein